MVERLVTDDGVPFDWHDDGVLWLVNRVVFHPRGFAVGHNQATDDWVLFGDGSETWRFEGVGEDNLFDKVNALFRKAELTRMPPRPKANPRP